MLDCILNFCLQLLTVLCQESRAVVETSFLYFSYYVLSVQELSKIAENGNANPSNAHNVKSQSASSGVSKPKPEWNGPVPDTGKVLSTA